MDEQKRELPVSARPVTPEKMDARIERSKPQPQTDFDRRMMAKLQQLKDAGEMPSFEEFLQAMDQAGQQAFGAPEKTPPTGSPQTSDAPKKATSPIPINSLPAARNNRK
jgi:hypothetical protein